MPGKQGGKKLPKRTGKRHDKHQACWQRNQKRKEFPNAEQHKAHKENVAFAVQGFLTPWEESRAARRQKRMSLQR